MNPVVQIARDRTAIHRPEMSRPIRGALDDNLINSGTSVLDYGCGHGDDMRRLRAQGIACEGWDPLHQPDGTRQAADIVNLGYVLNVIERATERLETIQSAWKLANRLLIVSARLAFEAKGHLTPFSDGFLTGSSTFQKFYEQQELRDWIDSTLGETSVAVAPGIFYVFHDPEVRQSFLASRYRRRTGQPRVRRADSLFDENRNLLETLMEFVAERGRLPQESELLQAGEIKAKLGTIRRAFSIIRRVTGPEDWDRISVERSEDLLVFIALAQFHQRTRFGQLSLELQLDVRAFFPSYKRACALADALLFSVGNPENIERGCNGSPVGKLTRSALYVHSSALQEMPSILRLYEGCAQALVGAVEGANIVKLYRSKPAVSYLSYPGFDKDPHPALESALLVDLQTFRTQYRDYSNSDNPPILHRKEEFISNKHPLRERFSRLTKKEEHHGLYETVERIGTRSGWNLILGKKGWSLRGHRLVKQLSK